MKTIKMYGFLFRSFGALVLSCASLSVSASSAPVRVEACPAGWEENWEEFRRLTASARDANTRGDVGESLALHLKAWPLVPECSKMHLRRLHALEVLLKLLRAEEPREPGKAQRLEQAATTVEKYLETLAKRYGDGAPETFGFVLASGLSEVVRRERAPFLQTAVPPEAEPVTSEAVAVKNPAQPALAPPKAPTQPENSTMLVPPTADDRPAAPLRDRRPLVLGWTLGGVAVGVVGGGLWLAGGVLRNIAWSNAACDTDDARTVGNCRERLARAVNIEGAGSLLTGGGVGLAAAGLTALAKAPHRRRAWIAEAGLGAASVVAGAIGLGVARRDYNSVNQGGVSGLGSSAWTAPEYISQTEQSIAGIIAGRAAVGLGGGLLLGAVTNLVIATRRGTGLARVRLDVTGGPGLRVVARF